jgi:hypothetical protein
MNESGQADRALNLSRQPDRAARTRANRPANLSPRISAARRRLPVRRASGTRLAKEAGGAGRGR